MADGAESALRRMFKGATATGSLKAEAAPGFYWAKECLMPGMYSGWKAAEVYPDGRVAFIGAEWYDETAAALLARGGELRRMRDQGPGE